jgi:uncharacterized protein (TIGR02466 family)
MHSITPLFPTPIFVDTIDVLTEEDIDFIKSLEYYPNASNNLTSEDTLILNHDRLSKLKSEIDARLKLYLEEVHAPEDDISLRITQSWVNKNAQGTGHHRHYHTNSIVSGVFYVSNNPNELFIDKKQDMILRIETAKQTLYNTELIGIECFKNMLILFPSGLDHYVAPNKDSEERISIAFNTFFSGTIGDRKRLNQLELS